jgi:predicted small secreted protein
MMLKISGLALGLAAALSLAGCNTPEGQAAGGGAVVGGATGALLGAAITGRPAGALLGGVAGAATGAMVGSASARAHDPDYAPPRRCAEVYYDYYGRERCRAWY